MHKPDNQRIYDENWSVWHDMKLLGPASRWLRYLIFDQIRRHVESNDIKTVVDVGCGEGTTTFFLAKELQQADVTGIDFSASGIDVASKQYKANNLHFKHDEGNSTLLSSFDLVTAFEVLEHVPEWEQFLGEMCTASNRYLLLSFPTGRMRPFEVEVGHYRNFKRGEVEAFLAARGFRPISVYYAGFPFYSPFYREFCNISNPASSAVGRGEFGIIQRIVASMLFAAFRFLSTKHKYGDQFCGLFQRSTTSR